MENRKIEELEAQLAAMQDEIERLKQGSGETKEKPQNPYQVYEERITAAQNQLYDIFKEMNEKHGVLYVSTAVSGAQVRGKFERGSGTACGDAFEYPEDVISSALDVFSNPRRINVLKVLMAGDSTASELSQKTGLIGGQLYHHLSILESAKLIYKHHDRYVINASAQIMLSSIYAAIGGMWVEGP